jgi:hypothetical protein
MKIIHDSSVCVSMSSCRAEAELENRSLRLVFVYVAPVPRATAQLLAAGAVVRDFIALKLSQGRSGFSFVRLRCEYLAVEAKPASRSQAEDSRVLEFHRLIVGQNGMETQSLERAFR